MATLPYITIAQARTLLLARGFYTTETIPPDIELGYRIAELEAILTQWFNFRFPETDYTELTRCYGTILTLGQYPVKTVASLEYRLATQPGQAETFSPTGVLWHGSRTVTVPRAGYYRVVYTAGYPPNVVATLEPFIVRTLARYDEANGGFGWLTEVAGDVTEVTMPGGISQKKEYKSSSKADPIGSRTIDRLLSTFNDYRRRVIA